MSWREHRRSIATQSLWSMTVRITLLVCLTSGLAYWHLEQTLHESATLQLEKYIGERGPHESQRFVLAEQNLGRMKEELTRIYADPKSDGRAVFDDRWELRPDGTWRQQNAKIDLQRQPTSFYGNQVPITDELKSRLGLHTTFVEQFGTAYKAQFADTYITIPENGNVVLFPGENWGDGAPSDLDVRKEVYLTVAAPENNPKREIAWTGMYYDVAFKMWMVSVENPVDRDGQWVAVIGHDVLLDELMARAINDHLPGTANVLFHPDGRLISHPDQIEAIQKSNGTLTMNDLGPRYAAMYALAKSTPGAESGVVVDFPEGDSILAIYQLGGTDWYFAVDYPNALVTSAALSSAKFVFALGAFTLLSELGILYFIMRKKIAGPLQVLMGGAERLGSGDLSVHMKVEGDDEFGQLAESFNTMTQAIRSRDTALADHAASLEATVASRTSELDHRNRAMRMVLDTVQQALVIVDLEGRMTAERSAMADNWFGEVPADRSFASYVRPHNAVFAEWFSMGLEALQEGTLPVTLLVEQMPKRLKHGERTLEVGYQPIREDEKLQGLLVVISDITATIERERAEMEQRDLLRTLECAERDRGGFLQFLDEANGILEQLEGGTDLPLATTFRLIHTLKGNCGVFGMHGLARVCHDIEDRLTSERVFSNEDRKWLADNWEAATRRMAAIVGARREGTVEVSRPDYDSTLRFARRVHADRELLRALERWTLDPVQSRLERLGENTLALGDRLGKPGLAIEVDAGDLRVDASRWSSFWAACVHLTRNAVDHGIESSDERESKGKPAHGTVRLQAAVENGDFVMRVSDDGAGIAWDKLAERALRLGLPFETEADRVAVLFADGVTTREDVDEVSGRGIGMGAVRDEVTSRGGTIRITSDAGQGTCIEMRFSQARMTESTEEGVLLQAGIA